MQIRDAISFTFNQEEALAIRPEKNPALTCGRNGTPQWHSMGVGRLGIPQQRLG
jgi:hypothetical protein